MAKLPESERLELAMSDFRLGASPMECEKKYFINYKKIAREAKKRGYVKGDLSTLKQEMVRVREEIVQLPVQQQDTLSKEVDRIMEAKDFYATNARKVAKVALSGLAKNATPLNAKTTMDVLHKGLVVEGAIPYYSNAPIIHNSNVAVSAVQASAVSIPSDPRDAAKAYQDLMK